MSLKFDLNDISDGEEEEFNIFNLTKEEQKKHYIKMEKYYLKKREIPLCPLCGTSLVFSELLIHIKKCTMLREEIFNNQVQNKKRKINELNINNISTQNNISNIRTQNNIQILNEENEENEENEYEFDEKCCIPIIKHKNNLVCKKTNQTHTFIKINEVIVDVCSLNHYKDQFCIDIIKKKVENENIINNNNNLIKCYHKYCHKGENNGQKLINKENYFKVYSSKFENQILFGFCSIECLINFMKKIDSKKIGKFIKNDTLIGLIEKKMKIFIVEKKRKQQSQN